MKTVTMLLMLLAAGAANAGQTFTVKDDPANALLVALVNGGSTLVRETATSSRYSILIKDLTCHHQANYAREDERMGIASLNCKQNSDATGMRGKALGQSLALDEAIQGAFEAAKVDIDYYIDCAMGGRCFGMLKSLKCTVDTSVESTHDSGRFSCQLTTAYAGA